MRRLLRVKLYLAFCLLSMVWSQNCAVGGLYLRWSELPELPCAAGQEEQKGLAGAFVGIQGDVLIVGGGANFPKESPWFGGQKRWYDDVYILQKGVDGKYKWITDASLKLPRRLAYGVSVSALGGVVCIGGCDGEKCYKDVFLLKWDSGVKRVVVEPMPALPRPLAFMTGALVGQTIYVAGGQEVMEGAVATRDFWSLDLSKKEEASAYKWKELEGWPGPGRVVAVSACQNSGRGDCFYLFSGRNIGPEKETELLTDAYSYNPGTKEWRRLADIAVAGGGARCVMAAPAAASGSNHILVFGGDDGKIFLQLERLGREIREAGQGAAVEGLKAKQRELFENHPGFSSDILAYHTITDTWVKAGTLPGGSQVTTSAVKWGDSFVIPSGEVRPGVRTAKVLKADTVSRARFGWINYSILGGYLVALVIMGFYFSKREKTTDDFFKAGGRVPWWAAGLSIFGTQLSAITFMAIPAKSYATDWRHFMWNMAIIMIAPLVIYVFLPFFRRLNITTAYEYLEKRFNLAARLISSVMYIMFQFGRMGIVLFLPSIALSVVTGMDVNLCILLMGVLSITYTVLGGIEAVVWTDVLQVIVLLGGAVLCWIIIGFSIDGGLVGLIETANAYGKWRTFDFRFDLTTASFWVILLGGISGSLISYGSDQTVIQRYLTTKDERSAARGIWANAILCIPASVLFFGMGTALFVFYKAHPSLLNPTLGNADAIFPFYIVTQLPKGIGGLLIAGVFAASMSSLDSSMNSVATAVTTDFYRRFRGEADDRRCLRLARWITVVVGTIGTGIALMMAGWGIKSLWDQYNTVIGFFAGGLLGLFLLGIFSRRAHGVGAVVGLLASGVVQFTVKYYTPIHFMLYTFTGMASCVVIGYIVSLVVPAKRKSLDGLTLSTLSKLKT